MILLAPIVAIVVVLKIIFVANAIPKERLSPPPDLAQLKPRPETKSIVSFNKPYMNYEDFIRAKEPQSQVIEIYSNWSKRYEAGKDEYSKIWLDWNARQPFSDAQKRWLETQIEDLIKIAAADGLPKVKCEDVLTSEYVFRIGTPDNLFYMTRLLAKGSRCRRELGDERGAAEALLAIGPIANTSTEPYLVDYFFSFFIGRSMRDFELSHWLEASPPKPEIARMLRDRLAATGDSQPLDFHRQLELEYRIQRGSLISTLQQSYPDLFLHEYKMDHHEAQGAVDPWYILDQFASHPIDTVQDCSVAAVHSIGDKSYARSTLDEFEAIWAGVLKKPTSQIDGGEFTGLEMGIINLRTQYFRFEEFSDMEVRIARARATQAREAVNLAALDLVLQSAGDAKQPRASIRSRPSRQNRRADYDHLDLQRRAGQNRPAGAIAYDPTNGAFSGGDILLRLPLKIK